MSGSPGRNDSEKEPFESEDRFRQLFEVLPSAVYTCDAKGVVTSFNKAAVTLWGRRPEVGEDAWCGSWRMLHPDGRPMPLNTCPMAESLKRGVALHGVEAIIERPDGTRRNVLAHPQPLRDEAGTVIGAVNVLVDITEREQSNIAQATLAAIVESSSDAIISKDLSGGILSWNRAAERLFGYTAQEAIGRKITFLIPKDRRGEETDILERIHRGERVEPFETVRVARDGRLIPVSVGVSPVQNALGQIVGASNITRDITGQKAVEESLIEADRRKDEFLAMLGHELRNPLAALSTCVGLLDQGPEEEKRAWVENMIARQIEQLRRLVDDLVDVARIRRGKIELHREVIDLREHVEAAVATVAEVVREHNHRLSVSLPGERVSLHADPARFDQILLNLLTNAAKYTPDGGDIHLSAELNRGSSDASGEVVIRCRDTGAGIPGDALETIFEPFVQFNTALDRTHSGLGIGLTLVKRLTELHGGRVSASSRGPGRGSEFTLHLPVHIRPRPAEDREPESGRTVESVNGWRALVVDDNQDYAEGLAILLERVGYQVTLASDGHAGIIAAINEPPDLVLLDLGLPGLDGYAVAERMRRARQLDHTTIVAVSGYAPSHDPDAAGLFDARLVKPVNYAALLELVHRKVKERSSKHRRALA